jgi:hypothetical protein
MAEGRSRRAAEALAVTHWRYATPSQQHIYAFFGENTNPAVASLTDPSDLASRRADAVPSQAGVGGSRGDT